MKAKLKPEICYLSGLAWLSKDERSHIEVKTDIQEIEIKFVEIAVKLGVEPSKIMISEAKGVYEAHFYHSKLAKWIREIRENESRVFKFRNELSANFVAGMFDSRGNSNTYIDIKGISPSEGLMLENLDIHTKGSKVLNPRNLITLIKGFSIRIERIQMPGNERDLH